MPTALLNAPACCAFWLLSPCCPFVLRAVVQQREAVMEMAAMGGPSEVVLAVGEKATSAEVLNGATVAISLASGSPRAVVSG